MPEQPFSEQLEHWLGDDDAPKTLGELEQVFEEKTFAVTILLLMFVPALPIPTGGVTHVFEAITVLLGLQMILGRRTIWLPERWKRRELGSLTTDKAIPFIVKRVRTFERFSKPRLAALLDRTFALRVIGLVFVALAVAAALAPPFSGLDTVPALGAVVVALGVILGDVLVVGVGVALGAGGVALILTVGTAVFRLVRDLF